MSGWPVSCYKQALQWGEHTLQAMLTNRGPHHLRQHHHSTVTSILERSFERHGAATADGYDDPVLDTGGKRLCLLWPSAAQLVIEVIQLQPFDLFQYPEWGIQIW